jgi:hypothetical protein
LLRPHYDTTQRIVPGHVECEFQIDVLVPRGDARELTLSGSPGLHVQEVQASNVESWAVATTGSGISLQLNLREPFTGGRILVRAIAPLPDNAVRWVSPSLQLAESATRGELLRILFHPDLVLDDWNSGSFRLKDDHIAGDGFHILSLQDTANAIVGRPSTRLGSAPSVFDVHQDIDWFLDSGQMTLNASVAASVHRGIVTRVPFHVPAGWDVDSIESQPIDPQMRYSLSPGTGGDQLLTIEPSRPLSTKDPVQRWQIRLRAPFRPPTTSAADAAIAIPDIQPVGNRRRFGSMTIRPGTGLQATFDSPATTSRNDTAISLSVSRMDGTVRIRRRAARVQIQGHGDFTISAGRLKAKHQLQFTVLGGAPQQVVFHSGAPVKNWAWRTISGSANVQDVEPWWPHDVSASLSRLAARSAWETILRKAHASDTHGQWFRIVFDRPLTTATTIELTSETSATAASMHLPIITVLDAERFEGHSRLSFNPSEPWRYVTNNVRTTTPTGTLAGRIEFQHSTLPCEVRLVRGEESTDAAHGENALLLAHLQNSGRLLAHFSFTVTGWNRPTMPIRMPPGARILSITVGDKESTAIATPSNGMLQVPWVFDVGAGNARVTYELPFGESLWPKQLRVPAPELPVPVVVRRAWRLPARHVPIWSSAWQPTPGGRAESPIFPMAVSPYVNHSRALLDPGRIAPGAAVGEALLQLAAEYGRDGRMLVVDAVALQVNRITPDDPVPADEPGATWIGGLGLSQIAAAAWPLLTSERQSKNWADRLPDDVIQSIGEAARLGTDRSGRFCSVAEWLTSSRQARITNVDEEIDSWRDYETTAADDDGVITLAPSHFARCSGWFIAIFFGLILIICWRWRWLALTILGTSGALAWLWLPDSLIELSTWPLAVEAAALSIAVWKHLRYSFRPRSNPAPSGLRRVALAIVIGCAVCLPGTAAGPAPTMVYIIPGEPEKVLAPPELLDQLRHRISADAPTARAVLTQAHYEGKTVGGLAQFEGRFVIQCFGEKPALLAMPLGGVQLLSAVLDGASILPKAAGDRYVFELPSAGRHSLLVKFQAIIGGQSERELRFTTAETAISTLRYTAPPGIQHLQLLTARGIQRLNTSSESVALDADLGRATSVRLRWRDSGVPEPASRPSVQEMCMWDIQEASARLTAVFRYKLGSAFVRQLQFEIPADLDVARVDVRAMEETTLSSGFQAVQDWELQKSGGQLRMSVALSQPLSGQVQAVVELVPRSMLSTNPQLSTPRVFGEFERTSYLAARVHGWSATVAEARGLVRSPEDLFYREQWQPSRIDSVDQAPQLVFQSARAETYLRVNLRPPEFVVDAAQTIEWLIGPRTTVRATARWSNLPNVGLVEWEIPATVQIDSIQGEGLSHWSRTGTRLQAWFQRSATQNLGTVTLNLAGRILQQRSEADLQKSPVVLPSFSLPNLNSQITKVIARPMENWRLRVKDTSTFQTLPDNDLPGFAWSGSSPKPAPVSVVLQPARGRVADARVMTQVELSGRTVSVANYVMIEPASGLPADRPNTIWVDVQRSENTRLTLQLPPDARLRETRTAPGLTSWGIDLGAGKTAFTISSRRPLAASQEVALPLVSVRGAVRQSRQLTLSSPDLQPVAATGITRIDSPDAATSTWRIDSNVLRPRIRFAPGSGMRATGATTISTQVQTALDSKSSWILQSVYSILAFSETEWNATWPESAAGMAATLEGEPIEFSPAGARITLSPGVHEVCLVWRIQANDARPMFTLPAVSSGETAIHWRVFLPAKFRLQSPKQDMSITGIQVRSAADWDRALMQHGERLTPETLRQLQSLRDGALRIAEYRMQVLPPLPDETGPGGIGIADWLQQARLRRTPDAPFPGFSDERPFASMFQGRPAWQGRSEKAMPDIVIATAPIASPETWALTAFFLVLAFAATVTIARFGKMEKPA